MKRIGMLFISFALSIPLLCAQKIKIDGTVMDGSTNKPAEFANVVLLASDSAFVAGISTDAKGAFRLAGIEAGTYQYTESNRTYRERLGEEWLTDIHSGIEGKKYSLIGEGIYEKGFAGGGRHYQSAGKKIYNQDTDAEVMDAGK